ncbi:MAG: GNAT family N-acetyltransferase [Propionibacteriaceae bacterium]|nr:GNAT family N-acetyltransferase [Propionibacteriaceae bacterium]
MADIQVARPNQLADIYDRILARSFPSDELVDRATFLTYATWGEVLVSADDLEQVAAVAVADYSSATQLLLVEYLAVAPESREGGSGRKLLKAAQKRWSELMAPGAFLAELERPEGHVASAEFGDPVRRLKFYQRLGYKALALPYYQPALSPEGRAVMDLVLVVLVNDPEWASADGARFTEGARLEALLLERMPAPAPGEEAAWAALMEATRNPEGIELVELSDLSQVPRSVPVS